MLIRSFSIYTIGAFLTQGINFILLPLFTHYLTTADFGLLTLITTTASFLAPLMLLSIDGAISIEYYKNEHSNFKEYVSTSLFISVLSSLLIFILLFLSRNYFYYYFGIPKFWLLLIPAFAVLENFKIVALVIFQVNKKAEMYALISFSYTLVNVALSLFFVIFLKYNFTGRLYSQYISTSCYFFLALIILANYKLIGLTVRKKMMIDVLRYGLPLVLHAIGFITINLADRLFISHYNGTSQLGIYSLAYTIGSVISIIAISFNTAWTPHLFELLKENTDSSRSKIVKVVYAFIGGLFILTLILNITSPFIFQVFIDPKFSEGIKIVPWISMSSFFFGCYLAFTNFIFYKKKNKIFALAAVINIVLNLILNYLLIPALGIIGAAYATFVSFLIFATFIAAIASRLYPEIIWTKISK